MLGNYVKIRFDSYKLGSTICQLIQFVFKHNTNTPKFFLKMAISISSKRQFSKEMEKAGDTLVVANFHHGSSVKPNSDLGDYILLNIDLGKNQDIAISQCISVPTICCYKKKVRLTKLQVGYANANDKFKQVMTGYVASRKLTKKKKDLVENNNNQVLDSDDSIVGIPNQNEALKTKLEDEISVDKKPAVKSKAQHVSDFCVKILSTMEG